MDPNALKTLIAKSPEAAEQARKAAAKLIEHRRELLRNIAEDDLESIAPLLKVAEAIEAAANAYVWEKTRLAENG